MEACSARVAPPGAAIRLFVRRASPPARQRSRRGTHDGMGPRPRRRRDREPGRAMVVHPQVSRERAAAAPMSCRRRPRPFRPALRPAASQLEPGSDQRSRREPPIPCRTKASGLPESSRSTVHQCSTRRSCDPTSTTRASFAGVVRFDQHLVRTVAVPGRQGTGRLGIGRGLPAFHSRQRVSLVAAFNSGFRFRHIDGGYYSEHRTAIPLVDGDASLVIDSNGRVDIGAVGQRHHHDR